MLSVQGNYPQEEGAGASQRKRIMKLAIRMYGDPILREKGTQIEQFDDETRKVAENLIETMRGARGVGLAAQQIGETIPMCVIEYLQEQDVDECGDRLNPDITMPLVLINPEIIDASVEADSQTEGCLSFPDIEGSIKRSAEVTVRFQDVTGEQHELRFRGFLARVAQHEIDHLNGVLFIDHMTPVMRIALSGRLKRMRKETQARLV